MKPVWRYASLPGKDVLDFPRSFQFFSFLLKKEPTVIPLREIPWIVYCIQTICFPLFIFYLRALINENKECLLADVFSVAFTFETTKTTLEDKYVNTLWVLGFCTVLHVLVFLSYQIYKEKFTLPTWVNVIREFIFDIHPLIIIFPLLVSIGFDMYLLIDDHSVWGVSMAHIVISIIVLAIYLIFLWWAQPLYYDGLFSYGQQITSAAVRGISMFWKILFYAIVIFISLASRDKKIAYVSSVAIFIFNCFIVYDNWSKPWSMRFRFQIIVSSFFSAAVISIASFFYYFHPLFSNSYFLLMATIIIIICFIITHIFVERRYKNARKMLAENTVEILCPASEAVFVCQVALNELKVSKTVVSMLDSVYIREPTETNLISLVCGLLMFDAHSPDLDIMMSTLACAPNIARITNFFVYELYKRYTNSSKLIDLLTGVDKLEQRITEFGAISDKFWRQAMHGEIASANRTIFRVKYLLDDLCYDYKTIEMFFPSHPKTHSLYRNFFKKFLIKPDCKPSELNRFTINDDTWIHEVEVPHIQDINEDNDASNNQQEWINENVKKLIQKPIPIALIVISTILWIFLVVFYALLSYKIDDENIYDSYRESLLSSMLTVDQLFLKWTRLSYLFSALKKQYYPVNMSSLDAQILAQTNLNITTMHELFGSLRGIINELTSIESRSEQIMIKLGPGEEYQRLREEWFLPTIPSGDGFNISIDQMISSTINQIIVFLDDTLTEITEDNFKTFLDDRWDYALKIDQDLCRRMVDSMSDLFDYINSLSESGNSGNKTIIILSSIGFFIYSVVVSFMCILFSYNLWKITVYHFRPDVHPNGKIKITPEKIPNKTFCTLHTTIFAIAFLLLSVGFYFIQFGVGYAMDDSITETYEYAKFLIHLGNVSLQESMLAIGMIDRSINETNFSFVDLHNNFSVAMTNLINNATPERFDSKRINLLYDTLNNFTCNITKDSSPIELYSCWGPTVTGSYTVHFTKRSAFNNYTDPSDFIQMQYLFLDSLSKSFEKVAEGVNKIGNGAECETNFFKVSFFIQVFAYAIFLFVVLFEMLHIQQSIEIQYGRQITALPSSYTVSHRCLVSFVADLSEDEKKPHDQTPFFEIYENAGVAVVVLTEKLVIVSLTRDILKLFGYKAAQLLGQHIETLIPCIGEDYKNNEKKFYRQIELVRSHEASNRFSRTVTGCCSDRSSVDLKTSVSFVETAEENFFVVEFRSISRELFYDQDYIANSKLINEYRKISMPIQLFANDPVVNRRTTFTRPITTHYSHYAAVYIGLTNDAVNENAELTDLQIRQMKDMFNLSAPLYSGFNDALIVDATCEYAIVIFVSDDDLGSHLHNAVGFALDFSDKNPFPTHGIIIEGDDIDISLYPLQPSEGEKPPEQLRPAMTVEPSADVIRKLTAAIPLIIDNCLILPDNAVNMLVDVIAEEFPNDLGMDLSIIEIKITGSPEEEEDSME